MSERLRAALSLSLPLLVALLAADIALLAQTSRGTVTGTHLTRRVPRLQVRLSSFITARPIRHVRQSPMRRAFIASTPWIWVPMM